MQFNPSALEKAKQLLAYIRTVHFWYYVSLGQANEIKQLVRERKVSWKQLGVTESELDQLVLKVLAAEAKYLIDDYMNGGLASNFGRLSYCKKLINLAFEKGVITWESLGISKKEFESICRYVFIYCILRRINPAGEIIFLQMLKAGRIERKIPAVVRAYMIYMLVDYLSLRDKSCKTAA